MPKCRHSVGKRAGKGWGRAGQSGVAGAIAGEGGAGSEEPSSRACGGRGGSGTRPRGGSARFLLNGHHLPHHGPGKRAWQTATLLACGVASRARSLGIFSILEDIHTTSLSFFADVQTKHGLSKVSSWENWSTPH